MEGREAMKTRALLFAVLVVVGGGVFAQPPPKTRQVFASVLDQSGAPVLNLTNADFQVTESGATRAVVRVIPAAAMRITLLVDNSDAAAQPLTLIRGGLQAFLDAVPADQEIMLVTTGRNLRVRVPATVDHKKLKDAVAIIFGDNGSPNVLMASLLETFNRFISKTDDRWPVVVLLTTDGPEGSTGVNGVVFNKLAHDLQAKDAMVHAIVLALRGGGVEMDVAAALTQNTGGHLDTINTANALPDLMKALGARITDDAHHMAGQYQIDYISESTDPQPQIGVEVRGQNVRLVISASGRIR
jgi:hypothetical protein